MYSFLELAKQRYSCRKFSDQPVEDEKIRAVLEAARIAPSAVNYQPWHFIVIRDPENLERLAKSYPRDWFRKAPVVIVVCGNHDEAWQRSDGKDHCDIDIAIATDHLTLQATDIGLATCWVCNFKPEICSEILNLPSNLDPMVLIPLGYPEDKPDINRHENKRKLHHEIIHYEKMKDK